MIPLRDDNPTETRPILTISLIVLNVLIFLYQVSLSPKAAQLFVYQFGSIPAVVTGAESLPVPLAVLPAPLTLLTSMFLHGGWMHLIGNMWYLWIFGDNVENAMGRGRFIIFYLLSGLAASLAHVLSDLSSVIPSIGASGAISGVLGAYLMLYPRARVLVLVPLGFFSRIMHIPAGFVLGFWFVLQLISGSLSGAQSGGGVAWWAHIGGFVFGMLLVSLFKKRGVHLFNPPHDQRLQYQDNPPDDY
jgi:membrane associated rhomboid family serine protease